MTVDTSAPQQQKPATVAQTITKFAPIIAEALPKHLDGDRFARLALTTLRKTPQLQQCNPESFVGALLTAAALGLEPDVSGECYLVPYKRECTMIVGYQGWAKLFWQHPLAARLSSEYVCANDEFSYDKGLNQHLIHKPAADDRGKVVGYYAIVGLKNGATWFDVFTPQQISKLRGNTRASNIADPEHWMERKTALKQVLKLAPKATQMQQVYAVDEKPGSMAVAQQIGRHEVPELTAAQPAEYIDEETGEVLEGELVDPDAPDGAMFPAAAQARA